MSTPTATAAHEPQRIILEEEALVQGGLNFHDVTEAVAGHVEKRIPTAWYLAFTGACLLLSMMWFSLAFQVWNGTGTWGLNNPVGWGWAIVNFVWWVGIGHAGTLISAILFLFRQKWRTSINRAAEAMTLSQQSRALGQQLDFFRANGSGDTNVTATNSAGTANVTGDNFGIYVYNYYDAANITADNVSGDVSDGIYVRNAPSATDIAVTTTGAVTSSSDDGIDVRNEGTGTTTLSSTNAAGDASVTGDYTGIYVYQAFSAGAVSVTANNATGTYGYGVFVRSFGSGDTTVNIANAAGTGAATGYNGGVYVYNQYNAANVTVDNA